MCHRLIVAAVRLIADGIISAVDAAAGIIAAASRKIDRKRFI